MNHIKWKKLKIIPTKIGSGELMFLWYQFTLVILGKALLNGLLLLIVSNCTVYVKLAFHPGKIFYCHCRCYLFKVSS